MNRLYPIIGAALLLLTLNLSSSTASAQGTAFTYQGQLQNNGSPANGTYNLTFALFTTNNAGTAVAGPVTNSAVHVTNGLFTVAIDFGSSVWNGETNWLQIGVATNGSNSFTTLAPRQQLTPVPYAISAESLNGTVGSAGLSGTYGNPVNLNNSANQFNGSYVGNGGSLTNVNAATLGGIGAAGFWQTTGNTGTTAGVNFVGTTDNQPLELHANGQRILQLLPDTSANDAPDIIGGSPTNTMTSGLVGATISGGAANAIGLSSLFGANPYGDLDSYPALGASYSIIGGGFLNEIQSNATFSTVAGGALNTVQTNAIESTIGGGFGNTISGSWSGIAGGTHHTIGSADGFIGGGWNNTIQTFAPYSAIAGGLFNSIGTNGGESFIGGGDDNIIGPDGGGGGGSYSMIGGGFDNTIDEEASFIGGGQGNFIQGFADHSVIGGGESNQIAGSFSLPVYGVIAGGENNTMQTNSSYAVIGGGENNIASNSDATVVGGAQNTASGNYSTVAGGVNNAATGDRSFAAGNGAQAAYYGSFVWADASGGFFPATATNQFNVRAMGGVRVVTGGTGMTLDGQSVVPSGNYVFAYGTAPQFVTPLAFQNAIFTTTAQINGWALISSQQFQCNQAGLYLVHYTAEAHIADSMSMRGTLNAAEISGSQAYASTSGLTITTTISQSFLVSAGVGNILAIQYTGNNSTDELEPGGTGSTLPSISLTITRIQ
jgi:hypothetical protein